MQGMSVVKRILTEAKEDNLTGESAKVAFYLFLSLFPAILTLFALTGFLGGEEAFRWIMGRMETMMAPEATQFLEKYIREVTTQQKAGALGIGVLLTLWAASGGFAALADGLNAMYDIDEGRSWWRKRAVALGVLLAATVLLVGGAALIIAGPEIARAVGLSSVFDLLRWPFAFVLLMGLMWLAYWFLPARSHHDAGKWAFVGAIAGALVWLGITALFRVYVTNFGSYGETYGFVGAIIVLMLWLYLTSLSILLGGEVAAVLEARDREPARA